MDQWCEGEGEAPGGKRSNIQGEKKYGEKYEERYEERYEEKYEEKHKERYEEKCEEKYEKHREGRVTTFGSVLLYTLGTPPPPPSPPQNLTKLFILVSICQPFGRVLIL